MDPSEYELGYRAGRANAGVWGDESAEWLRGYSEGIDDTIQSWPEQSVEAKVG